MIWRVGYVQEGLLVIVSLGSLVSPGHRNAYLVTVAPLVVLGADVLEGVLDALLEGRHVRPVLPMLSPEVVGVQAGEEEGRGDGAVGKAVLARFPVWVLCVSC